MWFVILLFIYASTFYAELGHHASLYLSSDEVSDMDASFLITRDDLYHLSDGKIMSALLPRNSLVIDSVLGEGKLY